MKTFYLVFSILLLAFNSQAQNAYDPFRSSELAVSYQVHFLDISSFNNSLVSNRLPTLPNNLSSIGVTGGVLIHRLWFGGEATWQFGAQGSNDAYQTNLYGGNGKVKVGYVFIDHPTFAFYPSLGLGGGGTAIRVASITGGTVIDDDMLTPGSSLHSRYMLIDPALNADFLLGDKRDPSKLLLGFAVGYLLSPLQSSWSYGDDPMPTLEKFAPQGVYAKVKIGWCNRPWKFSRRNSTIDRLPTDLQFRRIVQKS